MNELAKRIQLTQLERELILKHAHTGTPSSVWKRPCVVDNHGDQTDRHGPL